MAGRKANGQFDTGNRFATGRPKRAVELEYLQALSDAVPLETWRAICAKAAEDAQAGDDKAREWIAKHVLGNDASLTLLAKLEAAGTTPADYVRALVDQQMNPGGIAAALLADQEGPSVFVRAANFTGECRSPVDP